MLAVGIFRVDNDALDSVDQFKGTVIAIARELKITAPAIYNYFPRRDDLV